MLGMRGPFWYSSNLFGARRHIWSTVVAALMSIAASASPAWSIAHHPDPSVQRFPQTSGAFAGSPVRQEPDAEARIAKLKRRFDCTEVKERAAFVCFMKDGVGGSLVRKRIEPVVTSTGALFLRSVYRDRDWIYHDHVVVQIGDQELQTDPVSSTSPQLSRRTVPRTGSSLGRRRSRGNERDDFIAETVSYRGADESAIVEAIAAAGSAPVSMQLAGGPRHFEKELSNDEKRLFAEATELAHLLRARRAAPK